MALAATAAAAPTSHRPLSQWPHNCSTHGSLNRKAAVPPADSSLAAITASRGGMDGV